MEILIVIMIVGVIWYYNSDYRKVAANDLSHSMGGGDVYLDPRIEREIKQRKKLDDAMNKELQILWDSGKRNLSNNQVAELIRPTASKYNIPSEIADQVYTFYKSSLS